MRRRVILLVALVALYLAFLAFIPVLDRLVLFPTTGPINARRAERRAIAFQGGELEIWSAASNAARPSVVAGIGDPGGPADVYVLRFYGNADRADRWVAAEAGMWGDRAVEVWGVNYPGFGGSTGPARLARIGPAALAAFDALKSVAADRPIVVFGASLGTTAALHIAAQRRIAGLILHNPPALRQVILGQGWWNAWLLAVPLAAKVPADLDSLANAKASHARAVFLLAENDEVVAPKYQALVVNAYAGEKRVITLPGADHNSPMDETAAASLSEGFDWLLSQPAP